MEDKFELKITPAAANDLDQIYYHITNILVAPQAADDLLDEIETAIVSLCDFPYRCQYSQNEVLRHKAYRRLVIHKYVVLYAVDEENKAVIVMRALYGAMDYEKHI